MPDSLWVIIPAHNEQKTIAQVIKQTKKFCKKIVVVDDGSKDSTSQLAEGQQVVVLKHIINLGKGAALKTGCDFAVSQGAKKMVVMDSDGQHDPAMIPVFLDKLKKVNIVFGYRRFDKNMPFIMKFGNWFINNAVWFLYRIKLKDTQSGYRAFTADAYEKIRWKALDYSMESEMIANAAKSKLRYAEIPIKTIYANKYKGTTVLDGIRIVFNMIFWKVKR
ncbi:MAG: glycosyltransferase family 2 protein [Nanoarchaeota archaeon]|nr:glycosyltransferase family 2 protein [Nanoarchaeota archaeon]MBU1704668.1 glycosyltransferase family 2 protein [Nanoarchaeota archaeon]